MVPALVVFGVAFVGFLSTAAVSNAIRSRRKKRTAIKTDRRAAKRQEKENKRRRKQEKKLAKKQKKSRGLNRGSAQPATTPEVEQPEKVPTQQAKKTPSDSADEFSVDDLLENEEKNLKVEAAEKIQGLKEEIKEAQSQRNNIPGLVNKKIDDMNINEELKNSPDYRNTVIQTVDQKWADELTHMIEKTNELIRAYNRGEIQEVVMEEVPSLPSVEDFVQTNVEEIADEYVEEETPEEEEVEEVEETPEEEEVEEVEETPKEKEVEEELTVEKAKEIIKQYVNSGHDFLDNDCEREVIKRLEDGYEDKTYNTSYKYAIAKSVGEKIQKELDKVYNLIDELDNGADPEEVIDKIPTKSFLDMIYSSEDVINMTASKFDYYFQNIELKRVQFIGTDALKESKYSIEEDNKLYVQIADNDISFEQFQENAKELVDILANLEVKEEVEETAETPEEVVETKKDKETVLKELTEYKAKLESIDGETLAKLVEEKLVNSNVKEENREVVAKTLIYAFNNTRKACIKKVNEKINNLEKTEDYEKQLENLPVFGVEWLDSRNCDSIIENTSKKADVYNEIVKTVVDTMKEKGYDKSEDNHVKSARVNIKNALRILEDQIRVEYSKSVDVFSVYASSAQNNINAQLDSMSRDSHFTQLMSDVARLKANKEDTAKMIEKISEIVEKNSYDLKMIGYLDLASINDKITALQNSSLELEEKTEERMTDLQDKIKETMESKINEVMSKVQSLAKSKANSATVTAKLNDMKEELLKAMEGQSSAKELLSISEKLESLENLIMNIGDTTKEIAVKETIEKFGELKETLATRFEGIITRMFNREIGKNKKLIETIKNVIKENNGTIDELSDDQFNKIVQKVAESLRVESTISPK